ncbi:MAG: hypothetical protein SFU84_15145 [Gemmatimonadales bacterium]|nr:hypothetical protein [Gemmatimonadales bacterium]
MSRRWVMALLVGASAQACGGDPTGAGTDRASGVALLNAMQPGTSVELTLDGEVFSIRAGAPARQVLTSAGPHRIQVRSVGSESTTSLAFSLSAGERRTFVVTPDEQAAAGVHAFSDSATTGVVPQPDAVKIRPVHAASGAEPMKLWLRRVGAPMDSSAGLLPVFRFEEGRAHAYAVRSPATYVITATSLSSGAVLAELEAPLAAGEVWTAVLTRATGGVSEFQIRLIPEL